MNEEPPTRDENPYRSPSSGQYDAATSAVTYPSATRAFLAGAKRGAKVAGKWVGLLLGSLALLAFFSMAAKVGITVYYRGFSALTRLGLLKDDAMIIAACAWTTLCAAAASAIIMGTGDAVTYWRSRRKGRSTRES